MKKDREPAENGAVAGCAARGCGAPCAGADPACGESRADTEAAVEGLLGRFERIADVSMRRRSFLRGLPEIDARTARLLSAFPDLFRVYVESKQQVRERITDTQIAFHAVQSKFFGRRQEILVLLISTARGTSNLWM